MGLTEYRRKRNFRVTSEPKGGPVKSGKKLTFTIQKHAASHLHYDFRLELDGVLKSWAVPKGPSLDPAVKRLAMHVEDHPVEYGDFEGIIPKGEYGGGTVMLWDQGVWEPIEDGNQGFRDGSLKFTLHGKKLKGNWMLVRRGGKRSDDTERNWFLFKERDEFAEPGSTVTDDEPLSITTGRNLDEIAEQGDRVWGPEGEISKKGQAGRTKKGRAPSKSTKVLPSHNGRRKPVAAKSKKRPASKATVRAAIAKALKAIKGRPASIPSNAKVQLATLAKKTPEGDTWIHEIKFDGYRMLCHIKDGKVRFISRNGKDWTKKFGGLSHELAKLPIESGIIDGEVVILEPDGRTSFQALQNAFRSAEEPPFLLYVFDLLYVNGLDVRDASIEDRKAVLELIVPNESESPIKFSDHVIGNGQKLFDEATRLKLEGIISKRLGRPYSAGRGPDWLKVKCSMREEFVIGGFTKPAGDRQHFGALAIGYHDADGDLIYAGRVGTGFDGKTLASLHKKFKKLVQKESPFKNLSGRTGQARDVTWLKPSLVAQVEFSNWTDEKQLRHPSFQGLREDKAAQDVVRDVPLSPKAVDAIEKDEKMSTLKKKTKQTTRPSKASHRSSKNVKLSDSDGVSVAGIQLSHPDKVLYPEDGITKLDLAQYYEQVAKWMLPHVENRLLSLVRCPGGSGTKCFFQKHPAEGALEGLVHFDVGEKNESEEYIAIDDFPDLISLVQLGVLEIHIWGSQADRYQKPDRLIFDLDPDPAVGWPEVVTAAKEVRLLLEELELISFIKTTGGKGLHIVVPIQRCMGWDDAKIFCKAVADFMVAAAPDRYIAKMSKAARKGKIFIDYLRNDQGSTAVAPYSTRNRPGAPVSVPLTWDELSNRIKSDHFTIRNLPARLAKLKSDPWSEILTVKQSINATMLKRLKVR